MPEPLRACAECGADCTLGVQTCLACGATLDVLARFASGELFARRFQIVRPLGRGGMGMVYEAVDREIGEAVALKLLRPDVARRSLQIEERFRSEIRLARRVRHRNVCSIFGDGEDGGVLYIAMELVRGSDLRALVSAGGLPPEKAMDVALQVAGGLEAIHAAGIVHRDLKPANVMLDDHGVVRVMDFGIAKQHAGSDLASLTATGILVGTPEYMSPEQIRGARVDYRTDLYALGALVFELFTGRAPFHAETPLAVILKHLHERPRFHDAAGLPPALAPVLEKAMAKDAGDRHPDVRAFADALRAARDAPGGWMVVPMTGIVGGFDDETAAFPVAPSTLIDATQTVGASTTTPPPPPRRWILIGGVVCAASAVLALLAWTIADRFDANPLNRGTPAVASGSSLAVPGTGTIEVTTRPPGVQVTVDGRVVGATPLRLAGIVAGAHDVALNEVLSRTFSTGKDRRAKPWTAQVTVHQGATVLADVSVEGYAKLERRESIPDCAPGPGDVDVRPKKLSGPWPEPPTSEQLAGGDRAYVGLMFVVTERGEVTDVEFLQSVGASDVVPYVNAAMIALTRWKFSPAVRNGRPVACRQTWMQTWKGMN